MVEVRQREGGREEREAGSLSLRLLRAGLVPDAVVRWKIRSLLRLRLRQLEEGGRAGVEARRNALLAAMDAGPVAANTSDANEQHYELPPRFFELVLGPRLKYSCALWDSARSLGAAEDAMLDLCARRARLADGQSILDLGCGWGSLSLWLARRFPRARITAVSNSRDQRAFIEARAPASVRVVTADMNSFDGAGGAYDRIVSIEMFEHMRNWRELLKRVSGWLTADGLFFLHVFSHREHAYLFEVKDGSDWMAKHFFTGGLMPSHELPLAFTDSLRMLDRWEVGGTHYRKTAEAWLANLDRRRAEVLDLFAGVYGPAAAERFAMWRVFFMACSELWGFRGGAAWQVSHFLFGRG